MKAVNYFNKCFRVSALVMAMAIGSVVCGQTDSTAKEVATAETTGEPKVAKIKPVKNTFESIWLIDNQTVMVPIKKTFEIDIMHRFGTIKNGYKDFYGFFAPSNIRLGFNYVPIDNLLIGVSLTKANMTWEAYGKYALLKQTKGKYPVSVTYYANAAVETRDKENFIHSSDRLMYFHQLMIAHKVTNNLSIQVAPSISHINIVNGYFKPVKTESTGADSIKNVLAGEMKHDHFAIAFSGRYRLKTGMAVIVNIDQPITKHVAGNPKPNISFGLELTTSAHAFQFFVGNYSYITPQRNNYFNKNDYTNNEFLIGFNITRLWNY